MVPALREEFNRKYTPEKYRQFLDALDKACGTHIGFRVSETPCFVPKASARPDGAVRPRVGFATG